MIAVTLADDPFLIVVVVVAVICCYKAGYWQAKIDAEKAEQAER